MTDRQIYVVMGSAGDYSDREDWPVRAFSDEDVTKAFVLRCEKEAREVAALARVHNAERYSPASWDNDWFKERCPAMAAALAQLPSRADSGHRSNDGPSYFYYEVQLSSDFLNDVAIEVQKARAKFPNGRHLLPALMEEVGELANALLGQEYGHGVTSEDVYREAVQVATVAMRIAEEGEPVFPKYQPASAPGASDDPPKGETTAAADSYPAPEDPAVKPESVEDREAGG